MLKNEPLCSATGAKIHPKNNKKKFFCVTQKHIAYTSLPHFCASGLLSSPSRDGVASPTPREARPSMDPSPSPGRVHGEGVKGHEDWGARGRAGVCALAFVGVVRVWVGTERAAEFACLLGESWAALAYQHTSSLLYYRPPLRTNAYQHAQNQQGGDPPHPPVDFPLMSARCLMLLFIPFFAFSGINFKYCFFRCSKMKA